MASEPKNTELEGKVIDAHDVVTGNGLMFTLQTNEGFIYTAHYPTNDTLFLEAGLIRSAILNKRVKFNARLYGVSNRYYMVTSPIQVLDK